MEKLVVFRVDASLEIGTGHVMRCLTLARALEKKKVRVEFICRNHEGHLIDLIRRYGFAVHLVQSANDNHSCCGSPFLEEQAPVDHASWLGVSQPQDLMESLPILRQLNPDWLIVDHYGIDKRWESGIKITNTKLMVIDDLADREHVCDLLLDQTFGRVVADYEQLLPSTSKVLTGSRYALLRAEFQSRREESLKRRRHPQFKKLLITMGGIDKDNITKNVIDQLESCDSHKSLEITVVMGSSAPHLANILEKVNKSHLNLSVQSDVVDMAKLMSDSDFCIGASGATTWERCCLGLPTIQIVSAVNQNTIANNISDYGAAITLRADELTTLNAQIRNLKRNAKNFVHRSSTITDGSGVDSVLEYLVC